MRSKFRRYFGIFKRSWQDNIKFGHKKLFMGSRIGFKWLSIRAHWRTDDSRIIDTEVLQNLLAH